MTDLFPDSFNRPRYWGRVEKEWCFWLNMFLMEFTWVISHANVFLSVGMSVMMIVQKLTSTGNDHEWLKKVLIEVQLLQKLSHQNLVSYRHVWLENVQLTSLLESP